MGAILRFSGSARRDPAIEECDDGNASDGDLCSSACRVVDALLVPPAALGQEEIPRARRLGAGRHVVAPACEGFAAVFASDDSVELAAFDRAGLLKQRVANLSGGSLPASAFDPVVAALPGGRYAVAWNDFGGDGSERGIALVAIDPAGPAPAEPMFANSGRAFSQYDPDILRAGGEVVVAWTDDASIATGTDVRFRRFSRDLVPLGDDEALAETEARESAVVLAEFGSSWAAAWRALGTTGEITRVRAGGVEWEVGPHAASPAGEKPALVAIDEQRLILAFSSQNAIDVAVLDTAAPGTSASVAVPPLVSGSASEPLLARTGEHVYLAWRSGAVPGDSDAEELWLKQITFTVNDGTTTLDLSREEIPLPRTAAHQHGDQRAAALTVVGRGSDTAIAALWEDYGRGFGPGQAGPDVAIELAPIPFLRLPANGSPLE